MYRAKTLECQARTCQRQLSECLWCVGFFFFCTQSGLSLSLPPDLHSSPQINRHFSTEIVAIPSLLISRWCSNLIGASPLFNSLSLSHPLCFIFFLFYFFIFFINKSEAFESHVCDVLVYKCLEVMPITQSQFSFSIMGVLNCHKRYIHCQSYLIKIIKCSLSPSFISLENSRIKAKNFFPLFSDAEFVPVGSCLQSMYLELLLITC